MKESTFAFAAAAFFSLTAFIYWLATGDKVTLGAGLLLGAVNALIAYKIR